MNTPGVGESHYPLVIDAGSSGSMVYLYQIIPEENSNIPVISMVGSKSIKPGISEFENDPEVGAKNILTLLDYAKTQVDMVSRKQSPVYLLATAGMRLYSTDKRDRIMEKIGKVIKDKACNFCSEDYTTLLKKYPDDKDYLHQYCLASTYYWNLFKNGFRFPNDQTKISGANTIHGTDITWTLGALLDIQLGFEPEAYVRD